MLSQPLAGRIMRPWTRKCDAGSAAPRTGRAIPNPPKSLSVLSRKDVTVLIMPGSFLYIVYCCIHISLSVAFIEVYGLDELRAGFTYLPFGIGAIVSAIISGRWIDHDYRVVAKAHGLPINKFSGDDLLQFPIDEARLRSVFLPTSTALISVVAYGWLIGQQIICALGALLQSYVPLTGGDGIKCMAAPLVCLFFAGLSIQTCFNIGRSEQEQRIFG